MGARVCLARGKLITWCVHTFEFQIDFRSAAHELQDVKYLQPNYTGGFYATVAASPTSGRRQRFDAWPTHGFWQYITIVQGGSLKYYPVAVFGLKDGLEHNYAYGNGGSSDDALAILNAVESYIPPGISSPAQGEGYNLILRPLPFSMWITNLADPTGFENWYAAH